MPEVLAEVLPGRAIAMLSGPSFAEEAVQGLPTAVSIATGDAALGRALAAALAAGMFRPYWTDDVVGVSLGGAVKNVLAIAAGIVEGRGLGHNAAAALITRGFAEMARLGLALGANLETLTGLSGLGDLVLTCHGPLSRNRSLGAALGKGTSLDDLHAGTATGGRGRGDGAGRPRTRGKARHRDADMHRRRCYPASRRGPRRGDPRFAGAAAAARRRISKSGGMKWLIGSSSPSRRHIRGSSSSRTRRRPGPACATPRPRSISRR